MSIYTEVGRNIRQGGYTLAGVDGHRFGKFYSSTGEAVRAAIKANRLKSFGVVVIVATTRLEMLSR